MAVQFAVNKTPCFPPPLTTCCMVCAQVVRLVESKVARFSEGLPKEADDANMAAAVAEVEVYRAEFVLPAPSKAEEVKSDEGEASKAAAASESEAAMDHGDEGEPREDEDDPSRALAAAQVRCWLPVGVVPFNYTPRGSVPPLHCVTLLYIAC